MLQSPTFLASGLVPDIFKKLLCFVLIVVLTTRTISDSLLYYNISTLLLEIFDLQNLF